MKEESEKRHPVKYQFYVDAIKSNIIQKKTYYTPTSTFVIVNYDKQYVAYDDTRTGLYRSVVFSYPDKNVVCYSIPKSIPTMIFKSQYPVIDEKIWVNEAVEGVSVNLFYHHQEKKWMIATKGSIGGKYCFDNKQPSNQNDKNNNSQDKTTFLDMFIDAVRGNRNQDLNYCQVIHLLPKEYCFNFVMQHPSNKMILPVERSQLYLVGVYKITYVQVEYIPAVEYESWSVFNQLYGMVLFPQRFRINQYSELNLCFEHQMRKGFMITNMETGERTHVKMKRYDDMTALLRIKPEIQYQYLCLWHIGNCNGNGISKVEEYVSLFPKMRKDMYLMRYLVDQFMKQVHASYMSKYVFKEGKVIVEKYRSHIYKLHHEIYLPSLAKEKIPIKYSTVVEYFHSMEPREMLYVLNWDTRVENHKDLEENF
jgi:hypothetical protein